MKDAFGAVLTYMRQGPDVIAIAPAARIGSVAPADGERAAFVRLVDMPTSRRPFGPGSGRMGMHLWRGIAQCYGPTRSVTGEAIATGAITARQLAGAVSDWLHNRGPVTVGTTYLARLYAAEISGLLADPDTGWPYYTVRLEVYAGDQPVA